MKKVKLILAIILVGVGMTIALKSLSITGYAIGNLSQGLGSILGLVLIIAGILVYLTSVFDFY
jgi:hypothetical protein